MNSTAQQASNRVTQNSRQGAESPTSAVAHNHANTNPNSTTARQRQEGAVQAFKITNEAVNYLDGSLADVQHNQHGQKTTSVKNNANQQKANRQKDDSSGPPTNTSQSRQKTNKSPKIVASSANNNGATTGTQASAQRNNNILAQSVLAGAQGSQLSSYQQHNRNTPTIVSISGHTASGIGAGAMHESQSMAEVVIGADGSTTVGHYKLGRDLGKGTFGKVKVGTHTLTGEKVAIKVLEKDKIIDVNDVDRVAREIKILKIVRHPVVVQLYEIVETHKELYLIMEYARGGELFEYIVNRKRVREKEAAKFLLQLISGIEYLHKLGICHRDLKPENLLMDDYNNIKIVDFGLSNTYRQGQTLKTACGSPCYAAPEMVAGKHYHGLPADVWSCGVILYAMVCGYLPFEDPKTNVLYKKILNADYTIPEFVSDECRDLMQRILNTDPTKRFTAGDIRTHSWFRQIKNVKDYPGIIIGQNPIPVDFSQLQIVLDKYPFDEGTRENARRLIEANKHNPLTTCYYLTLKRFIRSGNKSIADITKYNPQHIERLIQNELIKQQQQMAADNSNNNNSNNKLVMSFEVPSNGKSKTEEKSHQQSGFVVQVSGSTTNQTAMNNKLNKQGAGGNTDPHYHRLGAPPIEITSKLNGDNSGDGLVGFDKSPNNSTGAATSGNQGVMTVATIKPTQKQISETTVLQMNNIQRSSVVSDHRPVLTKQKQKIISSQDRPKVFAANKNTHLNSRGQVNSGMDQGKHNELLHRHQIEQPPRNQTSCNNRTSANQDKSGNSNQNFASVIMTQNGDRKSKAISQLARNSNLHFGSTNNYSELVTHAGSDGTGQNGQQVRYQSNGIPSDGELLAMQQQQLQQSLQFNQHQLQQSPSPHSYFKNKQAQKNLLMTSQNASQIVAGNAMASETFELAQRQIQNQRKLMQMTQNQFQQMNNSQISEQPQQIRLQNFAGRGSSQPHGSPMKLIPSKLTRKQILANALANQQQLPLVNAQGGNSSNSVQRKKPKTGNQYQSYQQQQNTSSSNIPHSQLVFQGTIPSHTQNMNISPANIGQQQSSDMQYMYFTPRDLINFHSAAGNVGTGGNSKGGNKPQQLNFGGPSNATGPLILNSQNGSGSNQANYFKNVVRLSQQPVVTHGAGTSHQTRRGGPQSTGPSGKMVGFQAGQTATQGFISRQQANQSPAGQRVSQTHQLIHQSLPASVKGTQQNGNGSSTSAIMRRRANMPQSVIQNTSNVLDWSTTSNQPVQPVNTSAGGKAQRSSTRGSSVNNHSLNQTHLNLGNFKKSNLTSSKLGGIQNILNKVPQGGNPGVGKVQGGSVDQKQQMSRSMNVQDILNQSMGTNANDKRLKSNIINQSQDVPSRMGLTGTMHPNEQTGRSQIDKYHTQHLNNNFITDVNQSFVLQGPTGQQKPSTQTSKQAALKKKHFQFQQSQFENILHQTQPLQGHSAQYALPLSSYDLTQINLNPSGNVVSTTPNQQAPNAGVGRANFGGGGKFKVHIEFQPN